MKDIDLSAGFCYCSGHAGAGQTGPSL